MRKSMLVVGFIAVGLGFGWGQGAPATTTLVMPPTPLLPTSATLVDHDDTTFAPDDSAEVRAILKEDGLSRMESRVVPAGHGATGGWLKAYEFGDATGAFSAYTYLRMGGRFVGSGKVNGTDALTAGGERVYLSGTSVVRASAKAVSDGMLKSLEVGLPKVGGRRGLAPLLPTMLPGEGAGAKLDSVSVRYALGPLGYAAMGGVLPAEILGWDKSAEVATAGYAGKGGKGTLTLLLYPTPQIAGEGGRRVEKAVNDRGTATFGVVKMRRIGPLVGMTAGGLTAEQAQALVTALHLNENVTFDKPMPIEFHVEVRKTATLLQSIAIFTGVMILAAVVIAVFLGGARAGWRVMHGKSAASEPEFLTINLRDKPKALFAPKDEKPGVSP